MGMFFERELTPLDTEVGVAQNLGHVIRLILAREAKCSRHPVQKLQFIFKKVLKWERKAHVCPHERFLGQLFPDLVYGCEHSGHRTVAAAMFILDKLHFISHASEFGYES